MLGDNTRRGREKEISALLSLRRPMYSRRTGDMRVTDDDWRIFETTLNCNIPCGEMRSTAARLLTAYAQLPSGRTRVST